MEVIQLYLVLPQRLAEVQAEQEECLDFYSMTELLVDLVEEGAAQRLVLREQAGRVDLAYLGRVMMEAQNHRHFLRLLDAVGVEKHLLESLQITQEVVTVVAAVLILGLFTAVAVVAEVLGLEIHQGVLVVAAAVVMAEMEIAPQQTGLAEAKIRAVEEVVVAVMEVP